MKPIKRGFKVWVRADKNGNVCEFEIYTGKDILSNNLGLGESVVMKFSKKLIGKPYNLYADNFFPVIHYVRIFVKKALDIVAHCAAIGGTFQIYAKKKECRAVIWIGRWKKMAYQ